MSNLQFLVDIIGKDRVLLGSDYPFPLGEIDREGLGYISKHSISIKLYVIIYNNHINVMRSG